MERKASSGVLSKIKSSILPARPSTPVIIVIIGLIAFGVFYYIDFSNRQANFIKRSFRHLTLIGDTIALQSENYYKAILSAPPTIDDQYLTTFLPGVLYSHENSKNYRENSIISENDNYYLFLKLTPTNGGPIYLKAPILSLLKDRRSTSIGSDIFSDVLLVDGNGRVIFQSDQAGPRIIQLDTLINYVQEIDTKKSDSNKQTPDQKALSDQFAETSTFSNLLDVQIAGAKYKLFLQPLYLKIGNTETGPDRPHYVLCGLIRSDQFLVEGLRVPYIVIMWIAFCALLLASSLPFLKMLFIKSRERFLSGDALRICLFMPIVTFLLSLATISSFYFLAEDDTDNKLHNLAEAISTNFSRELSTAKTQLDSLGQTEAIKSYPKNLDSISRLPDALKTVVTSYQSDGDYPFFNSVFWMDPSGHHRVLWTVRDKTPPLLDVGNRAYARNLFEKKYSYIKTGPQVEAPITLEAINSWITGENSLVSCIPHRIGGAGIVTKPLSLIGPFVPPGFGYAVINGDGLVLFHSEESRNLVESLFEESDMNRSLIGAVGNRANGYLDVIYRGKDCRFYTTVFEQIDHLPWTLVVFRERNPLRILYTEVLIECLICFLVLYVLICVIAYFLIRRSSSINSTEYPSKYFPVWLWPDKSQFQRYLLLNMVFLTIILGSLVLVFVSALPVVFAAAVVIPIASTLLYFGLLKSRRNLRVFGRVHSPHWKLFYLSSLTLFFILIATLPALAFFKICVTHEENMMAWRQELSLAAFYQNRAEKVTATYQRINFPSPEKREEFLNARLKIGRDALDSYESVSAKLLAEHIPNQFHCAKLEYGKVDSFIESWLSLIRPSFDRYAATSGIPKSDTLSDLDWHSCQSAGILPQLILDHYRNGQGLLITSEALPAQLPTGFLWWLGIAALILLFYRLTSFASGKLFLQAFDNAPENLCDILPQANQEAENTLIIFSPNAREQLSVKEAYASSALVVDIRGVCQAHNKEDKGRGVALDEFRVVVLDHFEFRIDDDQYNLEKLQLLEELTVTRDKKVFVVSTVDPLAYIRGGQALETNDDNENGLLKQVIERWAEVLSGFSKCHYRSAFDAATNQSPNGSEETETSSAHVNAVTEKNMSAAESLEQECRLFLRLKKIAAEISNQLTLASTTPARIINEVADRADAYYHTLWAELSIREKLLLIQLSQEGFVNPNNGRLVQGLMLKRLIVRSPNLRIFNESFRRFVATIESPQQITFWEQKSIKGGWASIRIIFWAGLIGLVAFLLYTQRDLLQSGIAVLTAIVGAVAALLKVLDNLQNKNINREPEKL